MKSFKSIGVAAILFSLSLFILSCGNSGHSHDGDAEHTHEDGDHDHEDGHDEHAGHDHEGEEHGDHSHDDDGEHGAAVHGEGTAYTAAYVCPMHCEGSGSEAEGKCPVCNMDYIAQAEHAKDGHTH